MTSWGGSSGAFPPSAAPAWMTCRRSSRDRRPSLTCPPDRWEALLVPSAVAPGANLVLFPDHLDPVSSVELLAVEPTEI